MSARVVAVTGAGRGLGRAVSTECAARGATVVALDVDADAAAETVSLLIGAGWSALAIGSELATPADAAGTVAAIVAATGRLDGIVNNAGIAHTASFPDDDPQELHRLLDVHLHTPLNLVRAAWSHLVTAHGAVVNVVSNAALFGKAGMAAYAASKGALLGWTRAMALEAAEVGVRVNAVAPVAETRLTAGILGAMAGRLAPELVAPTIAALIDPACTANGQVFSSAGGAVARVADTRLPLGVGLSADELCALLSEPADWAPAQAPSSAAAEMVLITSELDVAAPSDGNSPPTQSKDPP